MREDSQRTRPKGRSGTPTDSIDAYFCPGVACSIPHPPTIVIWAGTPIPEKLFLHEFQHIRRQIEEQKETPDLKERWADYLARCDLLKYLSDRLEAAEPILDRR